MSTENQQPPGIQAGPALEEALNRPDVAALVQEAIAGTQPVNAEQTGPQPETTATLPPQVAEGTTVTPDPVIEAPVTDPPSKPADVEVMSFTKPHVLQGQVVSLAPRNLAYLTGCAISGTGPGAFSVPEGAIILSKGDVTFIVSGAEADRLSTFLTAAKAPSQDSTTMKQQTGSTISGGVSRGRTKSSVARGVGIRARGR